MIPMGNDFNDPLWRRIVWVTATQMGKTASIFNVIGWIADDRPAPMIYIGATQSNVDGVIEPKLMQMFREAKSLAEKLSRGKKSSKHHKRLAGISLRLAWAGSASEVASDSAKYIFVDELDRPEKNATGEGDLMELAEARGDAYADSVLFATSTPTTGRVRTYKHPKTGLTHWAVSDDVQSPIWREWQSGTRHEWAIPCGHCRDYFIPRSSLLHRPTGATPAQARKAAALICPTCGTLNADSYRQEANQRGRFVAPGQWITPDGIVHGEAETAESDAVSRWISGLCSFSPKKSYGFLAQKLTAAERSRDSAKLQGVFNTGFGEVWAPDAASRNAEELRYRAKDSWDRGTIPRGVRFIVPAVDVQTNRFVVQVIGFGLRGETWLIDRYDIFASPATEGRAINPASQPEDWGAVTAVARRTYALADGSGRYMRPILTVCDSGGRAGVTARAYDWWRGLRRIGLAGQARLVKGDNQARINSPRVAESYPDSNIRGKKSVARGDVPVLLLNTTVLKDSMDGDLRRTDLGKGYIHFPEWAPDHVYDELAAEVRLSERWENPARSPNEAWDLMEYARAGQIWLESQTRGGWGDDWARAPAWASDWDTNPMVGKDEILTQAGSPVAHHRVTPEGTGRPDLQRRGLFR